jgi:hypothetical protein
MGGVRHRESRFYVLALVLVCSLESAMAHAQSNAASEYQVKGAFLYNFAKFVEWPAEAFSSPDAAMQICIFGDNPFGEDLQAVARNKSVAGHPVRVVQLRKIREARGCHILFIASPQNSQPGQILAELRGISVLTVSDVAGFTSQGGMINFVVENERVRFEVNAKAAVEARLRISSKLLSLARSVTE